MSSGVVGHYAVFKRDGVHVGGCLNWGIGIQLKAGVRSGHATAKVNNWKATSSKWWLFEDVGGEPLSAEYYKILHNAPVLMAQETVTLKYSGVILDKLTRGLLEMFKVEAKN